MPYQKLPPEVIALLTRYAAPPGLIAHLIIVHDVASTLIQQIDMLWPQLDYDREAVLIGAATHDIGKVIYPNELTGPGTQHEEIGPQLLQDSGFSPDRARFARTHGQWSQEAALEDLLVTFADKIWKGKRDEALEQELAQQIARQSQKEAWEVYMELDDMANGIAEDADERIVWQAQTKILYLN